MDAHEVAPHLQRSRAATEAIYLMMSYALDILGYRRLEWKCDSLNAPSRAAAERFGFSFEGIFHQAAIYKGRNRDTAWYAIVDTDWPLIKKGFESWLAPDNFDETGQQKQKLANLGDRYPGLIRAPFQKPLPYRSIWLLLHRDLRNTTRVRLFVDFLAQRVRSRRHEFWVAGTQ